LPIVPECAQPSPQEPIRRGQFGSLDGALQNAELMAKGEDLELKRRPAPKGGEKCGQESGQQVPEGESKEKRWSRGVTRWFRWSLSVADPFVYRCLINPILPRFHTPLIEPDMRN